MKFAEPLWLLVGFVACAFVVWRFRAFDLRQQVALGRFASTRLLDRLTASVSLARRRTRRVLLVAGLMLTFVALARPQAGYVWEEEHRKGLEILFAVDTSKSMLSEDVKPDRLTRAKLAVHDLVEKMKGDGVGLVAFAGNAFLQCPITLDYDAFLDSLDALDTNAIPRGGTDIAAAIHEAESTFKTRTASEKILVLVTDGEDLEASGITAAQEAAKHGVKIFTVGVGTVAGELIPSGNGTGFVKDDNGQPVKSHLDEATLRKIAKVTDGMYEPLGAHGEGLEAIYQQGLARFTRHDLSSRRNKVYLEQFHWALLAAVACFMAGMLVGTRREVPAPRRVALPVKGKRRVRAKAATGALALLVALPIAVHASPQTAEKAYQSGDFARAQQDYAASASKQPAKPELQFNAGSAAYKAGNYAQAATDFQSALKAADVPVQQGAYYDLGNTQYRIGEKTAQSKPQETIKTWGQALKSYDAALQMKSGDADAKYNRDLVQRKLDALKKREEEKQQKQDQQKNQDSKGQKNQAQPQSGNSQQQNSKDSKGGSKDQQNQQKQDSKGDSKNQQSKGGQQKKEQPADNRTGQRDQAKSEGKQQPKGLSEAQQQQSAEGNDRQDQASRAPHQKPQPEPAKKISQGQAQAAHPEEPKGSETATAAADQHREPGQMTQQEAEQLLDGLKGDEQKLPAFSQLRDGSQPRNDQPLKDW